MGKKPRLIHNASRLVEHELPGDWKPELRHGDCFRLVKTDRIFGMQRRAIKIPDDLVDKAELRPVHGLNGWEWRWAEMGESTHTHADTNGAHSRRGGDMHLPPYVVVKHADE